MAESWVRLWSDMTTDPKWQTIARKSGKPRHLVIALFTHLMLEANDAEDRGSVEGVVVEDVASALDCSEEDVVAIMEAMDGRVIMDGRLAGWERRQPKREDSGDEKTGALSSTERSRLRRERLKEQAKSNGDATQGNAGNGDATHGNAPEAEAEAEAEEKTGAKAAASTTATARPDTKTSPPPDPLQARAVEIAVLLRRRGAALQTGDPRLRAWAESGRTDAELLTALETAERRRADTSNPQPVNAGYLDAILTGGPGRSRDSPNRCLTRAEERAERERQRFLAMTSEPGTAPTDGQIIDLEAP
jgi:hypothetical protein